jgi:hypothetical protein
VLAARLGLPEMAEGDSMSARLVRVDALSETAILLDGAWYRLCEPSEQPAKPAPSLPKPKKESDKIE